MTLWLAMPKTAAVSGRTLITTMCFYFRVPASAAGRLASTATSTRPWRRILDLKILADFVPTDEWVLEPGDMLYLPPQIAHHGVAIGECTTFLCGL